MNPCLVFFLTHVMTNSIDGYTFLLGIIFVVRSNRMFVGDMFDKDKTKKSHYHYRYVCCIGSRSKDSSSSIERQDGKIVNELKINKQADSVLKFLKGTHANVVMESGYNYQYLYDLLKSEGYNVKVAHPLMVKAIAYAKVKTDRVDARILADLLRTNMILVYTGTCFIVSFIFKLYRPSFASTLTKR